MTDILTKIIEVKKREVIEFKKQTFELQRNDEKRSLIKQLQTANAVRVISEIKRASPSKGIINQNVNPIEQAKQYQAYGAAAISVLTDETFFKGTIEDLAAVRKEVDVPLLCKDFIIDEIQIDRANQAGADVILLIAAALDPERLYELYQYAKQQNLEVLTEVHNEAELDQVMDFNPELIGINNRNLKTFEVNLAVTEQLGFTLKKAGKLFISESGMKTKEDVIRVRDAGAKGILVGETLMQANSLADTFSDLQVSFEGVSHER
jgi:indole-3-glycerol phosphate synthase